MDSKNLRNYYDVVIIGAGFAGIECAKNLGNSNLSVLLIEKDEEKDIGRKVCAAGVTLDDLDYLSKDFLNFDFQKTLICYKKKSITISEDNGIISTINKKVVLQSELRHLKNFDNINVIYDTSTRVHSHFIQLLYSHHKSELSYKRPQIL
ncbi:FAD-dependent oxidoreductase [Patescibacteria group bacterium]|nr:FAD-dependent oxidoreductase [Patescibacteria group bacterium]